MKILSLNCQRGYQPGLANFLSQILKAEMYDFLLLQEVDAKVLAFLQHPSYGLIRAFSEETGQDSELCIVYRNLYTVTQKGFQSFAAMRNDPWHGFKHPSFGVLWAEFKIDDAFFRLGSIHLHSGIDRRARLAELAKAKELLLKNSQMPTFLSGDFNAGYPGESKRMARALAPEFIWASQDIGPTLDSRYSENVPHLPNRIATFLKVFNIGIPLYTDHVFIDQETAKSHIIQYSVLSDRVSDHSPIEFTIEPLK